ncbi:MAG: DUF2344 domain-containing protein [Oscillospiraceae bacterium]|nr:DUF2344 domain-containing protein [Oscillospiraceae bacterium]
MSKFILKYGRDDRVKFISHLDFVRCFHRAVRRSKLNFEFSQGFNPHPVMTIAQPLPVAVTSECEYMKVGLITGLNNEQVTAELNRAMPPGFTFYKSQRLKAKEIDLTQINMAEYIVEIECNIPGDVDYIMSQTELIVPKKTKKGISDSDIRPHIFELENIGFENGIQTVRMLVSCGSQYNLRPETVVSAMEKYCEGFGSTFVAVHRKRMLIDHKEVM